MSEIEENCGNCKYVKLDGNDRSGYCRLNPPTRIEGMTDYPRVYIHYWCGQWKEKGSNPSDQVLIYSDKAGE